MRAYLDQSIYPGARTVRAELRKQAIDQPLHYLWTFAAALLPFGVSLANPPALWLAGAVGVSVGNVVAVVAREWWQWPSSRWWDPPLDWAIFALGLRDGLLAGLALIVFF